jgi:hypothetical protein
VPWRAAGGVTLRRVLRLPGRAAGPRDINLDVRAGGILALVGPTGRKVNVGEPHAALYDPAAGRVLLDGIRDLVRPSRRIRLCCRTRSCSRGRSGIASLTAGQKRLGSRGEAARAAHVSRSSSTYRRHMTRRSASEA